jgi:uncharacterized protein YpmB
LGITVLILIIIIIIIIIGYLLAVLYWKINYKKPDVTKGHEKALCSVR